MIVREAGHDYLVEVYKTGEDGKLMSVGVLPTNMMRITFIKKIDGKDVHPGTTNEEVLSVLIDRIKNLDSKFPCEENKEALKGLNLAMMALQARTIKREEQGVEGLDKPHKS